MKNFMHIIVSSKNFDATVEDLITAIEKNQFKVLHVHDVRATLAAKKIELGNYKIIEFCRAPAAKRVLDADLLIGLFLPCRAIVFEKDGKVQIAAMSPKLISQFFPDASLGDLPESVDTEIASIIQNFNL